MMKALEELGVLVPVVALVDPGDELEAALDVRVAGWGLGEVATLSLIPVFVSL